MLNLFIRGAEYIYAEITDAKMLFLLDAMKKYHTKISL